MFQVNLGITTLQFIVLKMYWKIRLKNLLKITEVTQKPSSFLLISTVNLHGKDNVKSTWELVFLYAKKNHFRFIKDTFVDQLCLFYKSNVKQKH